MQTTVGPSTAVELSLCDTTDYIRNIHGCIDHMQAALGITDKPFYFDNLSVVSAASTRPPLIGSPYE